MLRNLLKFLNEIPLQLSAGFLQLSDSEEALLSESSWWESN